jgi:ArsR family metal-binding transcriptional regulator
VDFADNLEELLPYLNAELGPCIYDPNVPFLRFRKSGKTYAIYPNKILMNPLRDEEEAEQLFQWVRQTVNSVARRKEQIRPSTWSLSRLKPLDLFRLLPRTNCGVCGKPSCMAFAASLATGEAGPDDCPSLAEDSQKHAQLLSLFREEQSL